jgi:DNA-binding transcriptional regulator YhcF (GntR family)
MHFALLCSTSHFAFFCTTGSATVKAVLLAVANYADEEGVCWPSQEQLGEDTELSRHTIMRALDQLEEMGLLERERRHRGDGSRTSDLIVLDLSSTQQRSTQQRSTQQQPKSHSATAEPIIEPSLNRNSAGRVKRDSEEDAAVKAWNDLASDLSLPKVQRMTETRRRKLAARLRDCGGLDGWAAAMAKIRGSPLCRGEVGAWRADFDFVLQESSFVKLMEGKYDGRSPGRHAPADAAPASGNNRQANRERLRAIIEEAERRENEEGGDGLRDVDARAA